MPSKVAQQWEKALASGECYRYAIRNTLQYLRFKLRPYSIKLKCIIRLAEIKSGMKVLDFGAGGGRDSVPLAYMGCELDALDCSDRVLRNLIAYKKNVERYTKRTLTINTICADIFDADLVANGYDVIFSCGVMEHFLNERERTQVYQILARSLKKNGSIVTSVPNGNHPLRTRQRAERLGGYDIEEIDYTVKLFENDIKGTGLALEKVRGFDLCGYIFIFPKIAKRGWLCLIIKPFYLFLRLFENLLPFAFVRKYAYWLFFVARKP